VTHSLETPLEIGGHRVENRLYRAPLLECAGDGPGAVDRLIAALEPAAAAGAGLVCQGAMVVRREGGRVAPNMTSLVEPTHDFERLTETIGEYGTRIFAQLDHGGLRSLETWHRAYREDHLDLTQLAVSEPLAALKLAARAGFLDFDYEVLSTGEVYDLAADFGRAAERAIAAGYDGIHLAGANMGIIQQFLSPYYNARTDEFGGSLAAHCRFLERIAEEIRERVGDVPLMTKVPVETDAPPFVRPRLSIADGVAIARRLERSGFDALVPVRGSTFWDMGLVRGNYPERAWSGSGFEEYVDVFGSEWRARVVALANRVQARQFPSEPGWNAAFCRRVAEAVAVPVLCEGGLRRRSTMEGLLGDVCEMVGMGRPFYAEPRLPARLLDAEGATTDDPRAVCESCNNCVVPQATGARGVCRTPAVLEATGELCQAGAYERSQTGERDGTNTSRTK
jgi:2,4-dienoyl-CoA reductase-like NADH-dependent reductase (Old Yellow Enzyme family)